MPRKVVILGCGPSGLAAAEAAVDSGCRVLIASSTNKKSTQYGCQYLHAPIPGHESVAHTRVGYYLNGTADQYRIKVYGDKWQGKVSPEDFVGEHDAWDIRATYQAMWTNLHGLKQVEFIKVPMVKDGFMPTEMYDFIPEIVISTIPATSLCYNRNHYFLNHVIYARGSTEPEGKTEDVIFCDGTDDHEWYRTAIVFGYRTTEWSRSPNDGLPLAAVIKPLATNCDCRPDIYRVGRYGKWEKGYLVHQVYPEIMEILK